MLNDQHGIALVAQAQQQGVHSGDVVRVQPDRRLVENVGDIGQSRAEVTDHFGSLSFTARQRASGPIQAQIAQANLVEGIQKVTQRTQQRGYPRFGKGSDPLGQI